MPRDTFRELINQRIQAQDENVYGQTLTRIVLVPWDTTGVLMPVVDVMVNRAGGVGIISAVPVAANNHELTYAAIGTPVRMRRSRTGRVEIVGVDKRAVCGMIQYSFNLSLGQSTSVTASFALAAALTLGQLGGLEGASNSTVFGQTPLGAFAMFDYLTGTYMFVLDQGTIDAAMPGATSAT